MAKPLRLKSKDGSSDLLIQDGTRPNYTELEAIRQSAITTVTRMGNSFIVSLSQLKTYATEKDDKALIARAENLARVGADDLRSLNADIEKLRVSRNYPTSGVIEDPSVLISVNAFADDYLQVADKAVRLFEGLIEDIEDLVAPSQVNSGEPS